MHRGSKGRRALAVAAACLAGALTAAAGVPRPGSVQHPSGPVGGPELAARGVIVNYPARGGKPLPKVKASAFVIADPGTGQVLAARDPHGWYAPASTLKVLTAITLMPVLNPSTTVAVSARAADQEPSKVGLIAGDSYPVSDLFKAMLMISANDAAVALAQATGSLAKGVAMMNAEARHLQADDTVAKRPNGLTGPGQRVSAYDEALFARQALAIPQFMHDIGLRTAKFPLKPHRKPVTLWAQNTMLYTYPGDLGGKIGWTNVSGTTYIGWARRNGRTLIVTILHCKPLTEMTYAARLLNWGFAMDGKVRPVGLLVAPLPAHPAARPSPLARHTPAAERGRARSAGAGKALPPPARLGLPGVPLLAGLGTLVLAVLTIVTIALVTRRGRQAASLVAAGTPVQPGPAQPESPAQAEGPAPAADPAPADSAPQAEGPVPEESPAQPESPAQAADPAPADRPAQAGSPAPADRPAQAGSPAPEESPPAG